VRSRKGGRIIIEFYSEEEFEAIYEKLIGSGR
jgi:tRNA threonylcarbamoyladenosine modification (KEOPS) complex  Pcc1 subunit